MCFPAHRLLLIMLMTSLSESNNTSKEPKLSAVRSKLGSSVVN
jgi:hypothetical protein